VGVTSAIKDHELDADAPGWIHSSDGWYWRRCENGDVAIVRRIQEPDDRGAQLYRITAAQRVDESTWTSIVAHVSAHGETIETFRSARALHHGDVSSPAAPAPDPAEDSYQAAVTVYRQARALELDDTLDERPGKGKP